MQPLDKSFFGPLKAFYADECNTWLVTHPGRNIIPYQFCELFGKAYYRYATLEKAIHAFGAGGIWPINCNVFMDENFLPSSVTDFSQYRESYRESCRPTEEHGDGRAESSKVDKEVEIDCFKISKKRRNKITAKKERSKKRLGLKKGDGNQVKSTKQSHQIQCPGCEEMYADPPNEDWIQCSSCKAWLHENCSAYKDTLNFVRDLCQ
ncbi:hypothetical protein PR048_031613 [Dryococelus australis]|uniref:Zinc finger PHD-type domain-containing protein n=1 Tax=Dryococelus australis TaxID=614101 RepID=A0ABQ9G8Q6_9NEOP|nr:hypothetical protein PR048_031613 [Dryococelus australis]